MKYFLVYWYKKERPDYNGHDLVYAKNKREARNKYRTQHYSPIAFVCGPNSISTTDEEYEERMDGISDYQKARARAGEIVNIEEGT